MGLLRRRIVLWLLLLLGVWVELCVGSSYSEGGKQYAVLEEEGNCMRVLTQLQCQNRPGICNGLPQGECYNDPAGWFDTCAFWYCPLEGKTIEEYVAEARGTTVPPTHAPTVPPTHAPTAVPTHAPTAAPTTRAPTRAPTNTPTRSPTAPPTPSPTSHPTRTPTAHPTQPPTHAPTHAPTIFVPPTPAPTRSPTATPTSAAPAFTPAPTPSPTPTPTTASPTPNNNNTPSPTDTPTTAPPTSTSTPAPSNSDSALVLPQISLFGSRIWKVSCDGVIRDAISSNQIPDVGLKTVTVSFDYNVYQSADDISSTDYQTVNDPSSSNTNHFPNVIQSIEWQILKDLALQTSLLKQRGDSYDPGTTSCIDRLQLDNNRYLHEATISDGLLGISTYPTDEIDTTTECNEKNSSDEEESCTPVKGYFSVFIPTAGNGIQLDPQVIQTELLTQVQYSMEHGHYQSPDITKLTFIGKRETSTNNNNNNNNNLNNGVNTTPTQESSERPKFIIPMGIGIVAFMGLASIIIVYLAWKKRRGCQSLKYIHDDDDNDIDNNNNNNNKHKYYRDEHVVARQTRTKATPIITKDDHDDDDDIFENEVQEPTILEEGVMMVNPKTVLTKQRDDSILMKKRLSLEHVSPVKIKTKRKQYKQQKQQQPITHFTMQTMDNDEFEVVEMNKMMNVSDCTEDTMNDSSILSDDSPDQDEHSNYHHAYLPSTYQSSSTLHQYDVPSSLNSSFHSYDMNNNNSNNDINIYPSSSASTSSTPRTTASKAFYPELESKFDQVERKLKNFTVFGRANPE